MLTVKRDEKENERDNGDAPVAKRSRLQSSTTAAVEPVEQKQPMAPIQASTVVRRRSGYIAAPEKAGLAGLPYCDYIVTEVQPIDYSTCTMTVTCQKCDEPKSTPLAIHLKSFWSHTPISVGTKLRLFCRLAQHQREVDVSDSGEAYIITEPDTLVQCTAVAGGIYCRRRVVLNERFRGGCDPGNEVMILGTIVHCVFQAAVENASPTLDVSWMMETAKRIIYNDSSIIEQLWAMNITVEKFLESCASFAPRIVEWVKRHIVEKRPVCNDKSSALANGHIASVRDIEENVWCSKFGVRGKVDMSLMVNNARQKLVPVEIKTGKSSAGADHRGQALLYTLMLSSFNGSDEPGATDALLLYAKDGKTHTVHRTDNAMRGVLQLRNELAYYLSRLDFDELPEPIDEKRSCSQCQQLVNCAAIHEVIENRRHEFSLASAALSHLREGDLAFFEKHVKSTLNLWSNSVATRSQNADAWRVDEEVREMRGECIAKVRMTSVKERASSQPGAPDFEATFAKESGKRLPESLKVSNGDMLLISNTTRAHYSQFMGHIVNITDHDVTIRLDRRPRDDVRTDRFRLDKYQSVTSFGLQMTNLTRLMLDMDTSSRLRQLLITDDTSGARQQPVFTTVNGKLVKELKPLLKETVLQLTELARALLTRAVVRSLSAQDYALYSVKQTEEVSELDMHLLALLAASLAKVGQSVVVVSHSASRIDEILKRLQQIDANCADYTLHLVSSRSGGGSGMTMSEKLARIDVESRYDAMVNIYASARVIACTLSTVCNHVLFGKQRFNATVVDIGKVTTTTQLLGALLTADKFLLVKEDKMANELFDTLAAEHVKALIEL